MMRAAANFSNGSPRCPEYYPTRTEAAILAARAQDIAAHTPPGSVLVEFGSGSSRKTEILLQSLSSPAAYVPIDVSQTALDEACARLSLRFPSLRIIPILGDFAQRLTLPQALAKRPRLGFFPGSTIGNFAPLRGLRSAARDGAEPRPRGRLLTGVDLRKDLKRLIPAYNDAAGVTADFNLNILVRLNREMGANFVLDRFAHAAIFNAAEGRIEMHLVSRAAQIVEVGRHSFDFTDGETIHTENSYKYTVASFQTLRGGWRPLKAWTGGANLFSLHLLA